MTQKLSNYIERNVRQGWLRGKNRDEIAIECGISTGSVSNITKKFIDSLGEYDAGTIRELAIQLKKADLTPKDCAIGFQVNKILEKIGIANEEEKKNIVVFLKEIDNFAQEIEGNPILIRECLFEIIKISKEVPSYQLKNYIQHKRREKEHLENQVEKLKMEIQRLKKEKFDSQEGFFSTKNEIAMKFEELDWCLNVRASLEKEGIPVEDISLLSRLVSKIKKYSNNLDIFQIIKRIEITENLEKEIEIKKRRYQLLKSDIEILEEHDAKSLNTLHSKILKLNFLDEIEKFGFNFADLKKLKLRLKEIAVENKMNPEEIKEEFFDSLSQYADKIIAQNELERLNKVILEIEKDIHKKRANLVFQGSAGRIIQNLVDKGMEENDIIFIKEFIEMVDEYGLKPKDLIEFIKWVRVQSRIQSQNVTINKNLNLDKPIKKNNSIRHPYPFCTEENMIFIFHPLSNKMYSIPNNYTTNNNFNMM